MKIGILTFHRAINYGALFQTISLYHTIKTYGGNVEIVDYWCEGVEKQYHFSSLGNFKTLKSFLATNVDHLIKVPKKMRFRLYLKELKLTNKCNKENISYVLNEFEKLIVGSDQVWNPLCSDGDTTFLLNIDNVHFEKYSYAASIGNPENIEQFSGDYRKALADFKLITVREDSAAFFLREQIHRECKVVLDPVFLPDPLFWEQITGNLKTHEPYIFVYNLMNLDDLLTLVISLANRTSLKVIVISRTVIYDYKFFRKCSKHFPIKIMSNCGPKQFLQLLTGADFIVTDSFHGSALSIIFKKIFFTIPNLEKNNTNSRIHTLLSGVGLEDRLVTSSMEDDLFLKPIDYLAVEKKLQPLRKKSIDVLQQIITFDIP